MIVNASPFFLNLKYPFGISGNTRTQTPIVIITLSVEGIIAYGEASLPPYLPFSQNDVLKCFSDFDFSNYSLESLEDLQHDFNKCCRECPPAMAALDIAIHDLKGKVEGKPLYELLNINPITMAYNALTIGIDTPESTEKKIKEATEFKILKVKIGSTDDKLLINTIRKFTDKPIIADANQGIKSVNDALELAKWLADRNVLLLEQPLAKDDFKGHAKLTEQSPIPIVADESFQRLEDLEKVKNCFSGINVKLMKCGGITPARQIIKEAKNLQLKILMGCMNESSCANLAAAHLAPLCNWVDLDGPFLITNNPFEDFDLKDGKIILSKKPGIGLTKRSNQFGIILQ